MVNFTKLIFLAGLVLATPVISASAADDQMAELPSDVMGLIGRRSTCIEWSKKATDVERRTELDDIRRTQQSLRCDDVANDEKQLRQKYAGSPNVLRALDSTWTKVVKRLPVRTAVPPDRKE